jgi:hypothetical protein
MLSRRKRKKGFLDRQGEKTTDDSIDCAKRLGGWCSGVALGDWRSPSPRENLDMHG